jgi:hypothetical protein
MRGINEHRTSRRALAAWIAALGLLLGGGAGSMALAQGTSPASPPAQASAQPPDSTGEANEADESTEDPSAEAAEGQGAEDDSAGATQQSGPQTEHVGPQSGNH